MAKTTTTMYEMLQADLNRQGFSEFMEREKIDLIGGELNYMARIREYPKEIHEVVTRLFFGGYSLPDSAIDKKFKKIFINKFLNYETKYQTVELFSSKLIAHMMIEEEYIMYLYTNLDDLMNGKQTNTGNRLHDSRTGSQTLPQRDVNLNVDDTIMEYADSNVVQRDRDKNEGSSQNFDPERLDKILQMIKQMYRRVEKQLFLQAWG